MKHGFVKGGGAVNGSTQVLEVVTAGVGKEKVVVPIHAGGKAFTGDVHCKQDFVPKYTSTVNDMSWATKGVVVSVLNGDAIPMLQRRIFDAGFENLVIIPLGADKVFLRTMDDRDVSLILSEASDFFKNFFSQPIHWNKDNLIRERGAWVRIYRVPLHAWNLDFFKLCVLDCGRLLKVDDMTLDRDRFDFARVLLSTSSLQIINSEVRVMVDGVLFDFQIVEEWDFSLGEDACLFDDEENQDDDNFDELEKHDVAAGCGDVNDLLIDLTKDWHTEVHNNSLRHSTHEHIVKHDVPLASPIPSVPVISKCESPLLKVTCTKTIDNILLKDGSVKAAIVLGDSGDKDGVQLNGEKRVAKRTSSCPPGRVRSAHSSPWSFEWVNRHKKLDADTLLPSTSKNSLKTSSKGVLRVTKKMGTG